MPIKIEFLSAYVALTKTFTLLADKSITKDPYPSAHNFTSSSHEITTSGELFKFIKQYATTGHCLLKGKLDQALNNEPRKGHTRSDDQSQWVCLDFDRLSGTDINEELTRLGLGDVSYTYQWSSSMGMPGTEGTISCHVFMLLSRPIHANELKLWLQSLNFTHYEDKLALTRNFNALRWPLDVTTCQNDKLLYIAPPLFINMKDPMTTPRIGYKKGKVDAIPVERLGQSAPEVIKAKMQAKKNALRKAQGLKISTAGTSFVGEYEVQNKPGECSVTGIKDCGDFVRLNLNNGDSWAYYHGKENFELLHNFKGELSYKLREICPPYYADLVAQRNALSRSPQEGGELVLAFREIVSAKYYNGVFSNGVLRIYEARSKEQLNDFMQTYGRTPPPFYPDWSMTYDPQADFVVDEDTNTINMFQPSTYMVNAVAADIKVRKHCPLTVKVIENMIGAPLESEVFTAFMKWFACIFQRKGKPQTAWVGHGIEGTGKGTFFDLIASPLLGEKNCIKVDITTIEDRFNAWMKNKLLIMVDEIDHDDFKEKGKAANLFKNKITERTLTVRDMRAVAYDYPNWFALFFASNRPQPVFIPPTDRRYNVGCYQHEKLLLNQGERNALETELPQFANYLMNIQTSVEIASQICDTADRREIARLGVSSNQEVANSITNNDFDALWEMMPDTKHLVDIATLDTDLAYASAYAQLMKSIAADIVANNHNTKLTRDELATIFRYCIGKRISTSPNKFTSFLRHMNIKTTKIRKDGATHMGISCEWKVSDALKAELIKAAAEKPKSRLKVPA